MCRQSPTWLIPSDRRVPYSSPWPSLDNPLPSIPQALPPSVCGHDALWQPTPAGGIAFALTEEYDGTQGTLSAGAPESICMIGCMPAHRPEGGAGGRGDSIISPGDQAVLEMDGGEMMGHCCMVASSPPTAAYPAHTTAPPYL